MNNSIYDEYMRNVLGYQPMDSTYNYEMYYDNSEMGNMLNMSAMSNTERQELENCYPEIYRIVYPMVQKACAQNSTQLTGERIDNMTDEIYFSIEDREMIENRNKKDEKPSKSTETTENRQTTFRNPTLRDIIRILLLREFLGRPGGTGGWPGFPGGRPPFPNPPGPRPPRPPMRPPMGPPRPQPRYTFEQYNDLYEY